MKKIPLRMCSGCNEMKPKSELIRMVKLPDGMVTEDLSGKLPGRGAYVCKNTPCIKKIMKTRRIERSLSSKISDETYERILNIASGEKSQDVSDRVNKDE